MGGFAILNSRNTPALLLAPAILVVAGCGGRVSAFGTGATQNITIHAASTQIDTNGTMRFTATLADGGPAKVEWSLSGGDPSAGAGAIRADGLYTPPGYLTRDAITVAVNAELPGGANQPPQAADSTLLTVSPGFLQPLTPGNVTLGPGATVSISGSMAEVGGSEGIRFTLTGDTAGASAGVLSTPHCLRNPITGSNPAYTVCTVTYTAPAAIPAAASVLVAGSVASSSAVSWTRIQLSTTGITSNPVTHQAHLAVPVPLGSSSGNNSDYDASLGQLSDCCGGTLGALLQDTAGNQYVLSNNHVLARSDQSLAGETIIQPGLIDNGCTPYGFGPGATPVATLSGYPPLLSPATNVDAAIARVTPGAVDPKGSILELGGRQQDGALAPASPGISSTGGKGEAAYLGLPVAKSGRTTGLTCAAVSAVSVDVTVDYFTDCAETDHSITKTFTNQIAIAGNSFSDAGDSGALVVDTANAEPVGLFFAGGTDINGMEEAIANPVSEVLATLETQVPGPSGPTGYSFVGGTDHPVSCLTYGNTRPTAPEDAILDLSAAERERGEAALPLAGLLVNSLAGPVPGIARVGLTASKDHPGEAAVALYVDPAFFSSAAASIPQAIAGVATVLLPASTAEAAAVPAQPRPASLALVLGVKQRNAAALLKSDPAIFGVGVGQSFDDPNEAALVLFVDRKHQAEKLPEFIEGQRVRVIFMDRLHVTRSHGLPERRAGNCLSPLRQDGLPASEEDRNSGLLEDRLPLPD